MSEDQTNLVWEFQEWTNANGLSEEGDAMDLLFHPDLTIEQRLWLQDFIARWDRADADAKSTIA